MQRQQARGSERAAAGGDHRERTRRHDVGPPCQEREQLPVLISEVDAAAASGKRDRRVAARTRAAGPSVPPGPEPEPDGEPAAGEPDGEAGSGDAIVPMPVFDPFREAEKWR